MPRQERLGWWPSSRGREKWGKGRARPADSKGYQGPLSPGSGGCNTEDKPKSERTKTRSDSPLPTPQTGCSRPGQAAWDGGRLW